MFLTLFGVVSAACGGYHIGPLTVEWARNGSEYGQYMLRTSKELGMMPELRFAPTVEARWQAMRTVLRQLGVKSILDVGGIGSYRRSVPRYQCINLVSEPRAVAARCVMYDGALLPFENATFEVVMAETALHHASANASGLLEEMARVAARYVVLSEDILEPAQASRDVIRAFYKHDPAARYRTLTGWTNAGTRLGLKLKRFLVLHRVPLHLAHLHVCSLGYAPMAYFVWERDASRAERVASYDGRLD